MKDLPSVNDKEPYQIHRWTVPEVGLVAHLVLDNIVLGPAAGGIRTAPYPDEGAALADAKSLARAMTIKCALAGLDAGGGKMVVHAHPQLNRARAFAILGEKIEGMGGLFRTGADLGTTQEDIEILTEHTQYGHPADPSLLASVGMGVLDCITACHALRDSRPVSGLHVVVQGAGSMGTAVARALCAAGARVSITDLNPAASHALANELNVNVIAHEALVEAHMDVFSPCAVGGTVTPEFAGKLKAGMICGAANNILSHPEASSILRERHVIHVPDTISSAGAVIDGIGKTVMGLADRSSLIHQLGETAHCVVSEAIDSHQSPDVVAHQHAWRRIDAGE